MAVAVWRVISLIDLSGRRRGDMKLYEVKDIMRVTKDLETRGAKCIVNVYGVVPNEGEGGTTKFELISINVRFPNGTRWEIVDIELEDKIPPNPVGTGGDS